MNIHTSKVAFSRWPQSKTFTKHTYMYHLVFSLIINRFILIINTSCLQRTVNFLLQSNQEIITLVTTIQISLQPW